MQINTYVETCLIFVGNSTLREIFMKTDYYIRGKFFAFLIKVSTYFICYTV